jgi:hypothetical protein
MDATNRCQCADGAGGGIDPVNQLLSSTMHSNTIDGTVLKQFVYNYDPAGNRTSEQIQSGAGVSPACYYGTKKDDARYDGNQ